MAKVPEPVLQSTGSQRVLLRLTVVVSIVSLACLVFWFFGVFHRKSSPPDSTPTIFGGSLETVRVERRQFPLIVEQEGSVSMNASVTVSSRIKGRVREVPVNEGSSVVGSASSRGGATILAHLDEDEIRIALRQAQTRITDAVRAEELARAKLVATRSQLDTAKTKKEQLDAEYRRVKDAEKRNAASIRQVDYARSQRDAADTRLQALRADMKTAQKEIERAEMQRVRAESTVVEKRRTLSYATVRAPVSGQVSKRLVQVGDDVVPGQPLFVIATSPRPEFFMHFPESIAKGLSVGQELSVRLDAPAREISGKIVEIGKKPDSERQTLHVRASLAGNMDLVEGLTGKALIPKGSYEALVVPVRVVHQKGGLTFVEVPGPSGSRQPRYVTLGKRHGEEVEIVSGLRDDENVIAESLRDQYGPDLPVRAKGAPEEKPTESR